MFRRFAAAALLCSLTLASLPATAQQTAVPQASAQPAPAAEAEQAGSSSQLQDLGTLQAELAKVEAERQRLADQLNGSVQSESLKQLQEENQQLRNANQASRLRAQTELVQQRQRWFLVGGLTVAVALLLGFLLARGSRRKRNEWLN